MVYPLSWFVLGLQLDKECFNEFYVTFMVTKFTVSSITKTGALYINLKKSSETVGIKKIYNVRF